MIASVHKIRTATLLQMVMVCLLWLTFTSSIQAAVSISGVDDPVRNNILAYLQLDDEACDADSLRVRNLFAESETEIREALEVVGYYHVEIEKKFESGENCWQANFSITLGKPVVLRTVSIEIALTSWAAPMLGQTHRRR